jgi:hypothetical protein
VVARVRVLQLAAARLQLRLQVGWGPGRGGRSGVEALGALPPTNR